MDTIYIKDLEVFANHGVYPEENKLGQKFVISADLSVDVRMAGLTDELEYSVNYGEVSHTIQDFLQKHTFKLIEAAAEGLAAELFCRYPLIRALRLEIQKPWAPVGLPLRTVSVEIRRSRHTVYIALGSNMGEREIYLQNALDALQNHSCIRLNKVSPIYETEPYSGVEQQSFLNCCAAVDTIIEPNELLDFLNAVEAVNNRTREIHWGPRTLDIDILLYDDLIMHTERLCIPHIDMHNRMFVLKPLSDIAPYAYHPVKRAVVQELLAELEQNKISK